MKATLKKSGRSVEILVPLMSYKRGDIFIWYCPALDLMTYSKEESKLENYFDLVVSDFLKTELERKSLHKTLESLGWTKEAEKFKSPETVKIPQEYWGGQISQTFQKPVSFPCYV